MIQLTQNAVQQINQNGIVQNPVLQVINVKKIETSGQSGSSERYRLLLSDGEFYHQAMLATQNNNLVHDNVLVENSAVKLGEYICNQVNGRKIMIVLSLQVLGTHPKIGNPQNIESAAQHQPPAQPSHAGTYQPAPAAPPQQHNPQQSYYGGNGPVARDSSNQHFIPIRALNPYQNRWVIKARVTSKGDVRHWDKGPNNQGKLFSLELIDTEGTEIRATFFREAVDSFYDMLVVDSVYSFTNGRVKAANKNFSSVRNDYEISFGRDCMVQLLNDDASIQRIKMDATPIKSIADIAPNSMVDVLGVATDISDVQEFTSRAGKPLVKCEVTLADASQSSIKVTFWGQKAHELKQSVHEANPILGIKKCKVGDFGGRTLSTFGTSQVLINPDIPEAAQLRQWYDSAGSAAPMEALSSTMGGQNNQPKPYNDRHTFASIKDLGLGRSQDGKADYIEVKGSILFIKRENMWYPACPDESSNKKVVLQPNGSWYCEANGQSYPNCQYRYIMSMNVGDHTDSAWVTCFNESATKLLGHSADDMEAMQKENGDRFEEEVNDATFKTYLMKIRVKEEMVQDSPRIKLSLTSVQPIDYVRESKELIDAIKMYDTMAA